MPIPCLDLDEAESMTGDRNRYLWHSRDEFWDAFTHTNGDQKSWRAGESELRTWRYADVAEIMTLLEGTLNAKCALRLLRGHEGPLRLLADLVLGLVAAERYFDAAGGTYAVTVARRLAFPAPARCPRRGGGSTQIDRPRSRGSPRRRRDDVHRLQSRSRGDAAAAAARVRGADLAATVRPISRSSRRRTGTAT